MSAWGVAGVSGSALPARGTPCPYSGGALRVPTLPNLRTRRSVGDDVPGVHGLVAALVARFLVLHERIQRLAFVGELLGAVVARDRRIRRRQRRVARFDRRPVVGAFAGAGALAAGVLVEGVDC